MNTPENNLVKIGGLWTNQTKNGDTYFSGSLGTAKLMIFKNNYKEKETDPDYIMNVSPKPKKTDSSSSDF